MPDCNTTSNQLMPLISRHRTRFEKDSRVISCKCMYLLYLSIQKHMYAFAYSETHFCKIYPYAVDSSQFSIMSRLLITNIVVTKVCLIWLITWQQDSLYSTDNTDSSKLRPGSIMSYNYCWYINVAINSSIFSLVVVNMILNQLL